MIPVSQQALSVTAPPAHPRRRARVGFVLGAAFLLALIALPIATAAAPAAGPPSSHAAQAATATVGAADAVQTGAPAPVQTGGAAQPVVTGAPAPAAGSTQPGAPPPADSGAPWLPWLVGAVLVAGLAGLGVFALRQRSLTPVAPVQGVVPAGAAAAATAGTPTPPPAQVRCPNCDAMNPADRHYCDECGQDLQPAVAPVATPAAAPAVDEATTPYLETLSRADEQLEYVLARGTVNVGRALDNDVVIDDQFIGWQTVSPHHARLTREEDGFAIEDLGSDNGTFVNGARTGDNLLADGMVLALGKVEFIYRVPHE